MNNNEIVGVIWAKQTQLLFVAIWKIEEGQIEIDKKDKESEKKQKSGWVGFLKEGCNSFPSPDQILKEYNTYIKLGNQEALGVFSMLDLASIYPYT